MIDLKILDAAIVYIVTYLISLNSININFPIASFDLFFPNFDLLELEQDQIASMRKLLAAIEIELGP